MRPDQQPNCIFCKIASGELESDIVYSDDQCVAFGDLNPQAPVHVLLVPRKHIENLNDVTESPSSSMPFSQLEPNSRGGRQVGWLTPVSGSSTLPSLEP